MSDAERVPTHMALRLMNYYDLFAIATGQGTLPVHTGERPVQRWATMAEPSQEELDSVLRELGRSTTLEVLEPGGG
jgi:hypothetical protein